MKCSLCSKDHPRLFRYETDDGRESILICEDCESGATLYDSKFDEHYYEGRKENYYYKGEVDIEPEPNKIVILCEGGLVQSVYIVGINEKFEVQIIDHDNKKCGDKEAEAEYQQQSESFEQEKQDFICVY